MTQQALSSQTEGQISAPQQDSFFKMIWWTFTDTVVMTRRNLLYYLRLPQLLVFSTIQPVMFLLLFTYVFGGAIQTPGGKYINYLLPGIIVQTAMFGGIGTAVGLAQDLSRGLVDRFRSLPMSRAAVLAGRTTADSVRNIFVVLLMGIVGTLIGFRIQNGVLNAFLAVVIVIAFGHVFSWIFAFVGMLAKDPETAQVSGIIWVFPLVFASSIFVPPTTMPDWLRYFAENQPVSLVATVVRGLILGTPTDDWWKMVLWLIAIYMVFMPLSVWQYRRSTK